LLSGISWPRKKIEVGCLHRAIPVGGCRTILIFFRLKASLSLQFTEWEKVLLPDRGTRKELLPRGSFRRFEKEGRLKWRPLRWLSEKSRGRFWN